MTIPVLAHKIVLFTTGVVSLLGNGLLIVLLFTKRSAALGKYRVLLTIFALADIGISMFNAWYIPVRPRSDNSSKIHSPICIMREYGYLLFGAGALSLSPDFALAANMTFSTTFYVPFVLLSLHFIYRLISLTRPTFLRRRFWLFLSLSALYSIVYLTAVLILCLMMCKQQASLHFLEPLLSYSSRDTALLNAFPIAYKDNQKWNTLTIVCMAGIGVLFCKSMIICLVCVRKILNSMKMRVMEIRTRRLHVQLFRALIIQFAVPCFFMLLPLSVVLTVPLIGISLGQLGNICVLITAFFPAIDPLLVTLSIPRFRSTLLEWFYTISGQKAKRNERRAVERSRFYSSMIAPKATDTLEDIAKSPIKITT